MRRFETVLAAACALGLLGAGTGVGAEELAARWKAQQVQFRYAGFTTDYTCDGIRYKVRRLLLAAGAKDDAAVQVSCAGEPSEPQPFHNVTLGFSVAIPAEVGPTTETFPATWREVELRPGSPRGLGAGECELVEQFRDQVLPLFTVRNVEDNLRCVPKQLSPGQPDLRFSVLVPAAESRADAPAPDAQ